MTIFQVIILAIVQGLAELLPISSSTHVIVAEKLMGLTPSSPQMTLLLVMLHTGTMFSVIVYFWEQWKFTYFSSAEAFKRFVIRVIWATGLTGVIGLGIKKAIEKVMSNGGGKGEIELLFDRLDLIAPALGVAGVLILIAGLMENWRKSDGVALPTSVVSRGEGGVTMRQAGWIGAVQGLALPFRGFSRSGSTISVGMLIGTSKERAERFSFALAVVLTPAVVGQEALRLLKASQEATAVGNAIDLRSSLAISMMGMGFSFLAGLLALKWLSSWLQAGRWYLFGIYCIIASSVVFYLYNLGY